MIARRQPSSLASTIFQYPFSLSHAAGSRLVASATGLAHISRLAFIHQRGGSGACRISLAITRHKFAFNSRQYARDFEPFRADFIDEIPVCRRFSRRLSAEVSIISYGLIHRIRAVVILSTC